MGNPEIAAGPSSQALTGGHKKFSSKMADDFDFETQKRGCISKYGCCGAPWRDVRLIFFAIATLYAFVALFYLGLITAAMEVRQEEWLELQNDFFGPFSKVERPLLNSSNQPVPVRKFTIAEYEALPDADQQIFRKTFNRADGCEPTSASGEGPATFLECDRENDEDGRWALFPWVSDRIPDLNIAGCGNDATRRWSSLELDGTYGSPESTPGNAVLGPNTCLTYVPPSVAGTP